MKSKNADLMVGGFFILVLAVLTLMTFKVGDFSFGKPKGYLVYANFLNTAGLDPKTKIKIAGVDAGVIEKIELVDGAARVTIRMYPEVHLYSDASAYIKASGLLGDKFVELTTGHIQPQLKDGDSIANIKEVVSMDDLVRDVSQVSLKLVELIGQLSDPEMKDTMQFTLNNLRDLTDVMKAIVIDNRRTIESTIVSMQSLIKNLDIIMKEGSDPMIATAKHMESIVATTDSSLPELLKNLNEATAQLKKVLQDSSPEMVGIMKNANQTMGSVNNIAGRIERGEGTVGRIFKDEELYTSINTAVKGVNSKLDTIDRFRTYLTFRGDYLAKQSEGKGSFMVTLRPKQEKYYIFGITSDPIGKVDVTETTTNGVTVREEKIEANKMELTAHIGRRFDDTLLRIGLTENTFGVGADRFMYKDRAVLSVDAWDFSKDEAAAKNPHIRLGADLYATKNIFISTGVDNIFNSDRAGFFLGGGVTFEDDDFKYLMGSMPSMPGN